MRALVLYATLTGNNEKVADIIINEFKHLGVKTIKEEIDNVDVLDLNKYTQEILVTVIYTFDLGTLADEAIDFYNDLPNANLDGVVYGVAGSGDVYYGEDYCMAVDLLEKQFKKTKGILGKSGIKVNLWPDNKEIMKLREFTKALVNRVETS